MSNPTVLAAAEGMPAISRRNFLRSTAGAATLGGIAIMATSATAATTISADLASLIEAHREAYVALNTYSDTVSAAERAFFRDKANEDARQAKEDAHAIQDGLLSAEKAAFLALLAHPVSTLDELRAVVAVGKATWWEHDTVSDEEAEALLVGIIGKGA